MWQSVEVWRQDSGRYVLSVHLPADMHGRSAIAMMQIVALNKNNFERYRERIILQ